MTILKRFDRFAHEGVLRDLQRLKNSLEKLGLSEFGSSGEGELTVRGRNATYYARKYKAKPGWRFATYYSKDKSPVVHLESDGDVVAAIRRSEA